MQQITSSRGFRLHQRVRLECPENERLHGAEAVIVHLEEWGAHVACLSAATGHFRAAWHEMVPLEGEPLKTLAQVTLSDSSWEKEVLPADPQGAIEEVPMRTGPPRTLRSSQAAVYVRRAGDGYSGDCCSNCGGVRLRRDGKCLVCDDCGSTAGGCS